MNKRLLSVLLIALLFTGLYGQVKLDVKTRFKDKSQLTGLKHGVIFLLKRSGYQVVEIGETYTLWLENFREKRIAPDRYSVKLTVSLSPPALFSRKPAVASEKIDMEYTFNPKLLDIDDTGFIEFIKEKFDNIKNKELARIFYVGSAVVKNVKLMLLSARRSKKKTL